MKELNTLVNFAAMKQQERNILLFTRGQCMKESNTVANFAAMKQIKRDHLPDTIRLYIIM